MTPGGAQPQRSTKDVRSGGPRRRSERSADRDVIPALMGGFVLVGLGLSAVTALGAPTGDSPIPGFVVAVAIGFSVLFATVARLHFEALVLALIVVRPALDLADSSDGFAPSTFVGVAFLGVSVAWLVARWVVDDGAQPYPVSWGAAGLLAAALLSAVLSFVPMASAVEWARLASVLVMFMVLERLARLPGGAARMYTALVLSMPIPVFVALAQGLGVPWVGDATIIDGLPRVSGTLVHPNSLAMFLVFTIIPGVALVTRVRGVHRACLGGLLALAAVALLLTYTRSAWIGAALGLLTMAWFVRRRVAVVVAVGVALLALTPPVTGRFADVWADQGEPSAVSAPAPVNEDSLRWRFGQWGEALDLGQSQPVTGVGPRVVEILDEGEKSTHNDYVRALAELGVVGLAAYLALLARLVMVSRQALRRAAKGPERALAAAFAGSLVAFLVMSLTDNLMTQSVVMWSFAVGAAAASAVAAGATRAGDADRSGSPALPPARAAQARPPQPAHHSSSPIPWDVADRKDVR